MKPKILVVGSTGKLGIKLLSFCKKKNISIFCITCFENSKLLNIQSKKYNIKNYFKLSNVSQSDKFQLFLKKQKIDIIYFLDYGCKSLIYANIFLKHNKKSFIAIANKEMIIAGGETLINEIFLSKNKLIPLDSEHFSLSNINFKNDNIKKIYITASGGPFYFKKNIDIDKVSLKSVLAHPKWKMGINNSIDSSNFINKILEIYELSIIYKINLSKIDFLISQHAYVHSVVLRKDNVVSLNCFNNDMLIALVSPLLKFYPFIDLKIKQLFLDNSILKLEKFNDKRFKINKYLKFLTRLSPSNQIVFMILNNIAQKKYLLREIKYNEILDFIMINLKKNSKPVIFNSVNDRLKFIDSIEKQYGS